MLSPRKPKAKKCAWSKCSKMFNPNPFRFNQKTCDNTMCAIGYVKEKQAEKAEKEETPEQKVKRFKKEINSKNVFKYLESEINGIVRLIDYGHECITGETEYGKYIVNAGHYFSVGSNKTLRYNLLNIFNQSCSDNDRKGGRGSNYGIRLKEVFGQEIGEEIDSLPSRYPSIHLSHIEAKEALKKARQITRELKSAYPTKYTTEQRIELRKMYNQRIGIY
jgi:hypothetical protein